MKQYQFVILTRSVEGSIGTIETDLDDYGKDGWKLVTAARKKNEWLFYMQRRVEP